MVTNIASYTVIPNQPTPKGRLWLSDNDLAEHSPAYTPTIYVYKPKHNHHDVIERMRTSLSDILVYYYPLAGRLCWIDECGRMEVDCNSKGVTLLEAETTKTLDEYGDFSPTQPIKDLIPTIDYTQPIEELPLFLVQLTRFHGDQSLVIGVTISHLLCDGTGAIQFINSWAKLARGDTLAPQEMPFLDRTILKFPHSPLAPRFDHPELKPPPLIVRTSDCSNEQKKTTAASLKLTSEEVEKLKKKANDQSPKNERKPYSRYEAIAAHIWRCASKARELDDNQPTLVRIIADTRSRLNPPLPPNYFGNALARTVTTTCYVGEIISNPFSHATQKIRDALNLLTTEYIRSQRDVILGQEQIDSLRGFFFGQGQSRSSDPYFGSPNIFIVSWMSMSVYEADFGWGKPVHFGEGFVSPYDTAWIAQSPEGDGSIIVSMHFQIEHMQLFKKFFYQDI